MTKSRSRIVALALLSAAGLLSGAEDSSLRFSISVAAERTDGRVDWMTPGVPLGEAAGKDLTISFRPERDCYLSIVCLPEGGGAAQVLWPPLDRPEIMKARKNEPLKFRYPVAGSAPLPAAGSLSVLVFASTPIRFHADLAAAKSDPGRTERLIRGVLQSHSSFGAGAPISLVLIAGDIRAGGGAEKGLDVTSGPFWAGVYEWRVGPAP